MEKHCPSLASYHRPALLTLLIIFEAKLKFLPTLWQSPAWSSCELPMWDVYSLPFLHAATALSFHCLHTRKLASWNAWDSECTKLKLISWEHWRGCAVPLSPFDAVSQKTNQILVAHVPDRFYFRSEFLLCLAPGRSRIRLNYKFGLWICEMCLFSLKLLKYMF